MSQSANAPTGRQVTLQLGTSTVAITEVGGALRQFRVGNRDVIVPFGVRDLPSSFHGAVLLPWPNRLAAGQYRWGGDRLQVPITEPERDSALHGLLCWQRWQLDQPDATTAVARILTVPIPGYPFSLQVHLTYRLVANGQLTITLTTTNVGDQAAPYGVGFHPWLSPGPGSLDEAVLGLDVGGWVMTDPGLLPTGEHPLPSRFDFRTPRAMGSTSFDDAFVAPARDADELAWLRLTGSDGRTAAVWMDQSMRCWQVCSGDELADPATRRVGLAAEPMTCYANAFNTGEGVVELAPGAAHTVRWGLTLT
ncbi:MAG: aldose 1-epimerase family protein [Beutenbergiaceae bacterium]